jgi:predicted ATPase/tetratricopeptide (TPR) repeat protein
VGREAVLAEITALLDDPDCRLLTLVGPGGSGKTRLALEVAERQLDANAYPHGVFFVSLAPLDAVESIVPAVADALGFTFYTAERGAVTVEPQQQLLEYLRGNRLLLIMDNYEHLLAGARLVTEIHRTAPNVMILATSRARLNVGGEQRYQVAGMLYPETDADIEEQVDPSQPTRSAQDALQYSAIKLFVQGARRARPGFELTKDNLSGVVRVCRLVDGMPLAIRLAAGWVDTLTPSGISDEISRGLGILETERQDVPARQRSVRAVFDHSWRLLSEHEREVFQRISVFRGGFTREATQAVLGASLSDLRGLVNKSLLQFVPRSEAQTGQFVPRSEAETGQSAQEGRYQIHELLRQYADEKLQAVPGAAELARDRHSAFYTSALEGWGADLKGPRQQTARTEIMTDLENVRLAWDWAVEHGRVERIGQAMEGLGWFYLMGARHEEGESAFRTAADVVGKLAPTASAYERRVWARTLVWQGFFTRSFGHPELSGQLTRQSLALLEGSELSDQDTRADRAFALFEMAFAIQSGDPEGAKQLFVKSLALYQALGDRWMTARLLNCLGFCLGDMGDFGEAQQLAEESLALRRALDDKYGIINTLAVLSTLARAQGDREGSLRLRRESLALSRETGQKSSQYIIGLGVLSVTIAERGDFSEAAVVARQALTLAEDAALASGIAYSLELRATALLHLGDYQEANALARRYLTVAQKVEVRWAEAVSFFLQGRAALATAAYGEAQKLLRESALVLTRIGHNNDLSVTLAHSAMAARGLGQAHRARQHLCEGLSIAAELGDWLPLVSALAAAALLLADEGEAEQAVELYALASCYDYVANSKWFEDVAGAHIAAVAETLPPEVVTAAQERGRARDLWETAQELLEELGRSGTEQ